MVFSEKINFYEPLKEQVRDFWETRIQIALKNQKFGDISVIRDFLIKNLFGRDNDSFLFDFKSNRKNGMGLRFYHFSVKVDMFDSAKKKMLKKKIDIELVVDIFNENSITDLKKDVYLGEVKVV